IVNLINGDEFWAEKDKGAFLNGERIYAQKNNELYLVAYEAQSPKKDIPRIIPLLAKSMKTRCLGATALDLAYLAYGSISIFANPSLSRSFDFGGGWLIVKEAGGIFTDIEGNSLEKVEISLKKSVSLLAAGNENLHKEALKLLKQ
ncbi:MAG: inositol monophosphatase family protein, partial [Nitrospirota bacterium]